MLLIGVKEENGWLVSRWNLTYRTGWDGILKAAASVCEYYEQFEALADDKPVGANKEEILKTEEAGSLTFRGMSKIIKAPLMITMYNQTNAVDVSVMKAAGEFESSDYEKFNLSLGQYLDSIELAMHRA